MTMAVPTMKRVTVTSELALRSWLTGAAGQAGQVMLVTRADATSAKHVSREQMQTAAAEHGWTPGRRYTLGAGIVGQVIERAALG